MNDKVVSQPVAKRLKEAGWVKRTRWSLRHYEISPEEDGWSLSLDGNNLRKKDFYAPDLLDITREIREIFYEKFDDFTNKTHFNEILWKENEANYAAEIWIEIKREGL